MKLRIGTRKSKLALSQAEWVQRQIQECCRERSLGWTVEIVPIITTGDQQQDKPLHQIGSKGLFTGELEQALRAGQIECAVHSLKDLPTTIAPELPIIAVTEREEPWDALVVNPELSTCRSLAELPTGTLLGTSSLRRVAQLSYHFPHLRFQSIRGNIETRLRKIHRGEGGLSGGILAAAGLRRLALQAQIACRLPTQQCIPAPGQGSLAVQTAQDSLRKRPELAELLRSLNHPASELCTAAERACLQAVEGGCQTPFGAHAILQNQNELKLCAFMELGDQPRWAEGIFPVADPLAAGYSLAERLKGTAF